MLTVLIGGSYFKARQKLAYNVPFVSEPLRLFITLGIY